MTTTKRSTLNTRQSNADETQQRDNMSNTTSFTKQVKQTRWKSAASQTAVWTIITMQLTHRWTCNNREQHAIHKYATITLGLLELLGLLGLLVHVLQTHSRHQHIHVMREKGRHPAAKCKQQAKDQKGPDWKTKKSTHTPTINTLTNTEQKQHTLQCNNNELCKSSGSVVKS